MIVDWELAWQISGVGFGITLVVLILALIIWLIGLTLGKINSAKPKE